MRQRDRRAEKQGGERHLAEQVHSCSSKENWDYVTVCVCVCVCECVCVSDSRGITEQWIAPLFLLQASCADSVDRNTHRLESGGVMTWDGGSRHAAVPHPPVSLSKMWSVWTSLFHRADLHRGDGVLLPLPGGVSGDWISLHEKYVPIPPSVIPRFPTTFV